RVLSIGAVRADGLWVGYSAEGPGRLRVNGKPVEKPDLCAPTLFRDELLPFDGEDNSGTSAACGVAAGVVAAARSCPSWGQLSPEQLRTKLREDAVNQGNDPTSRSRFGDGILNAAKI
ncbi:MAG TPA: S8 family serine peptidase, partial [Acetobacteraceae bacterium]